MKYFVYILYSDSICKFYIGQTQNIIDRVNRHNSGREKYTSKGTPWELVFITTLGSRAEAMKLERKIKNFKSQKRITEYISTEISKGRGSRKI